MTEAGPSPAASRLVLALGAILEPIQESDVEEHLRETPWKKVLNWVKKHIGATMQKLRAQF